MFFAQCYVQATFIRCLAAQVLAELTRKIHGASWSAKKPSAVAINIQKGTLKSRETIPSRQTNFVRVMKWRWQATLQLPSLRTWKSTLAPFYYRPPLSPTSTIFVIYILSDILRCSIYFHIRETILHDLVSPGLKGFTFVVKFRCKITLSFGRSRTLLTNFAPVMTLRSSETIMRLFFIIVTATYVVLRTDIFKNRTYPGN